MRLSGENLAQTVWFLDYDGSLCPHQEVWEERQYDAAEIMQSVNSLRSVCHQVFWNTGRRRDSLAGVNPDFLKIDGYFVMGSYRWDAKSGVYERLGPSLPVEFSDLYGRLIEQERDRFKLEIKESALRIAPIGGQHLAALLTWIDRNSLAALVGAPRAAAWEWVIGNRGVELLARGFDKSFALRRELQHDASLVPIVVGDDRLDRSAAEEALTRGGHVLLVGDNCGWISQIKHRASQIHFFEQPADVLKFLDRLAERS